PKPICFKLLIQLARRASSLARANTGNRIAASIPMMATTTRSSIKVNPLDLFSFLFKLHKSTFDIITPFNLFFYPVAEPLSLLPQNGLATPHRQKYFHAVKVHLLRDIASKFPPLACP